MIEILRPDDWHCHFRDGDVMRTVVPLHAKIFNRCLVMPNKPEILDNNTASAYLNELLGVSDNFTTVMTIMLTEETTKQQIESSYNIIKACKLYPKNVTTSSHHGVRDILKLFPVFEAMQEKKLILCVHAEEPSSFIMTREKDYLKKVAIIAQQFPGLKIVIEHISTKDAVDFVNDASVNIVATITAHHLHLTLDDVLANGLKPHNFCYPVAKTPTDLQAIICAALFNNGKFFFGSDTAPHLRQNKETACGCAGIFMPGDIALNMVVKLFAEHFHFGANCIRPLENFMSVYGATFYGYPITKQKITIHNDQWLVPDHYNGIVPFMANQTLNWKKI